MFNKIIFALLLTLVISCKQPQNQSQSTQTSFANSKTQNINLIIVNEEENKGWLSRFFSETYHSIKTGFKNLNLKAQIDLVELSQFALATIIESKPVLDEEYQHNIDMLYADNSLEDLPELARLEHFQDGNAKKGDVQATSWDANPTQNSETNTPHQWVSLKLGTKFFVPITFSFPNLIGLLGVNLGTKQELNRIYTLKVRTDQALKPVDGVLDEAKAKLAQTYKAFKAIRIPLTAKGLLSSFVAGTEIKEESKRAVISKLGLNFGVPALLGNANIYMKMESNWESTIKILYGNDDNPRIRFTLKTISEKSKQTDKNIALNLTIFETSIIKGVLGAKLLSFDKVSSQEDSITFDYIYDLSYSKAAQALEQALKGNLESTQNLAVTRNEEEKYQGVILYQENTSMVTKVLKTSNFSFSTESGILKDILDATRISKVLAGLVGTKKSETFTHATEASSNFILDSSATEPFTYIKKKTIAPIWGLFVDKTLEIHAVVKLLEKENPHSPVQLEFVADFKDQNTSDDLLKMFFNDTKKLLGKHNPPLHEAIVKLEQTETCESSEKSKYKTVGVLSNITIHNLLRLPIHQIRDNWRQFSNKNFEKKFFPLWIKIKEATDSQSLAKNFYELFKAYGDSPLPFLFLVNLVEDLSEEDFTQFKFSNEKCNFTWTLRPQNEE